MLPIGFDHREWQPSGLRGDQGMPRSKGDPRHSSDAVAALADVSRALSLLPEDEYNVIIWRFKLDYTDDELGEVLEISPSAANKRVQRAVKRLQKELGGSAPFKEYTGSRTVQRNSAARAQQSATWEG